MKVLKMAKKAAKKKPRKKATKSRKRGSAVGKAAPSKIIREITELIQVMVDNGLTEIGIADGRKQISLKRGAGGVPGGELTVPAPAVPQTARAPSVPPEATSEPTGEELLEVTSPMVGTFYTAPSPDSDPCVTVGSVVDEDTVVGIIEAMKVMNEIKAQCAGTIAKVCVKNTQPVEFGQVLFCVKGA